MRHNLEKICAEVDTTTCLVSLLEKIETPKRLTEIILKNYSNIAMACSFGKEATTKRYKFNIRTYLRE